MNSIGRIFSLSIYGESHGKAVGIVIDGCPPGILLKEKDFIPDLARRKSGPKGTTPRREDDDPNILSGVFNGTTTGAPIHIMFTNSDAKSRDYESLKETPRPGHADYVAHKKYIGFNDYRGSGHFSGRLTVGLVAAGVVAKKIIPGIEITAKLIEAGGQTDIEKAVDQALLAGDSIGGIVECQALHVPIGLGEPFFDSLESQLCHICFAIPAIKGIEFGAGFNAAGMKGSEHNDTYLPDGSTSTNHSGGINGGISNGNELIFRVAVKPTSSISITQYTAKLSGKEMVDLEIKGRHDACIALRVPVVLEAVTAVVLADNALLQGWIID